MHTPTSLNPVVMPPTTDRASKLKSTCHAFCKALESPPPPRDLMNKYFSSNPKITEHGPEWARSRLPFLAKTYTGNDHFMEYFDVLSKVLSMKVDPTPPLAEFAVQVQGVQKLGEEFSELGQAGLVFVQGGGEFKAIKTGKAWKEKFVYRFSEFDEDGKIGHWEIWADPLSAWEAVGGE